MIEAAGPVAAGLHMPTGLALGEAGEVYLCESGLALGGRREGGRLLRLAADGTREILADNLRAPVNGITCHRHLIYIAEGGKPGRISCFNQRDRCLHTVLDGLPGGGNYHTNKVVVGGDDWLYFGQGALTNSGIVGLDAMMLGWLKTLPHPCDIPGRDVVLQDYRAETEDPRRRGARVATGVFANFGESLAAGSRVAGRLPCTAAVMRCRPDGSDLELVAWGLRNPYGLLFDRRGRLLAIDLGINDRGSRPVGGVPDCLFEVIAGRWYGWPDYAAGKPVNHPDYTPVRGPVPGFLLANHEELGQPALPLYAFEPHAAPTRMARFPSGDNLAVALFGDKLPMTGPPGPRVGRSVVSLNPDSGETRRLLGLNLHRPIDLAFDPSGALYVLDFGRCEMITPSELQLDPDSGALYRFDEPLFAG